MSDSMGIDVEDYGLTAQLGRASRDVIDEVHKVITKGALNIKESMREDARESRYFRRIERYIDFDQVGLSAEIGPNKRGAGNLANIAYFGGAHGGGGTVRDPQRALDEELPRFERAILDVTRRLL